MKNKSIKLPYLILLALSFLMFTNLDINAIEKSNMQVTMDKGLDIVNEFDYYEIKTPEEYNNIGKEFKKISKECLGNEDQTKKEDLKKILNDCYEVLNKKSIDMLEVNQTFEKLIQFGNKNSEKLNKIVKRSEIIKIIEENIQDTEGIISR